MNLRVSSPDELLFHLSWADGKVEKHFAHAEMNSALDRWISFGIREWVDVEGGRMPRMTPESDPLFLERLRDDLKKQFPSFHYTLIK